MKINMKIRNKFQTNEIKNINIESKEIKLIFVAYQYNLALKLLLQHHKSLMTIRLINI